MIYRYIVVISSKISCKFKVILWSGCFQCVECTRDIILLKSTHVKLAVCAHLSSHYIMSNCRDGNSMKPRFRIQGWVVKKTALSTTIFISYRTAGVTASWIEKHNCVSSQYYNTHSLTHILKFLWNNLLRTQVFAICFHEVFTKFNSSLCTFR
jgi:hypothetical protein